MKCGARVALGVAGGYFLGRTKKMKLAMALAGMVAGKRAGGPGELLAQGTKLLGKSPDLTRLSDEVRGRLIEAGKAAAVAVATRQVEALTDRVTQRVAGLTDVASDVAPARRRRPAPEDEVAPEDEIAAEDQDVEPDVEPEAEPEPEPSAEAEEPAEEPPPPPRRRASGAGARGRADGAARRASGTATRAASKAGGRAPRTRRSDDD